jgi:hypothetical protein
MKSWTGFVKYVCLWSLIQYFFLRLLYWYCHRLVIKRLLRSAHQIYLVSVGVSHGVWVAIGVVTTWIFAKKSLKGFYYFSWVVWLNSFTPTMNGLPPTNNSFSHLVAAGDQTDSIATISKLPIHSIRTLKAFKERTNLRNEWMEIIGKLQCWIRIFFSTHTKEVTGWRTKLWTSTKNIQGEVFWNFSRSSLWKGSSVSFSQQLSIIFVGNR